MYCSHTPLKVNTSPKKKPSQKEFHHQTINFQVLFEGGYHISPMNSRVSRIIRRISIDRLDTCRALASCLRPTREERAMKEILVGLGCIWNDKSYPVVVYRWGLTGMASLLLRGVIILPSMTNLNTALLREYSSKSLHICILWISPNE